jgi:asparagine synthetase B (glutamine-hydrolysing)
MPSPRVGRADPRTPGVFLRLRSGPEGPLATGARSCVLGHPFEDERGRTQGVFARWEWDEGGGLRVDSDRYGVYPAYWGRHGEVFAIGSTVEAVLRAGIPPEPDPVALAVLLRTGYLVGDDTVFRHVRRVPPEATVRTRDGLPELAGGPFTVSRTSRSRSEVLDEYVARVRVAVQRRLPSEPFLHMLSGGRDSRHLLFALVEAGARPEAVVTAEHYPPRSNEDARVAALVAAHLGLPHRILAQPRDRLRQELRKNVRTNFSCHEWHAWGVVLGEYVGRHTPVSFDGLGGDTLSMGRYLDARQVELYGRGDLEGMAESLLRDQEATLKALLEPELLAAASRDAARARLVEELSLHSGAANPVRSFRFWSFSRRKIAPAALGLFAGTRVRAPYLDHDVFDLLASVAPEELSDADGHLHTEAILRGYPEHAHLEFEDKRAPSRDDAAHVRRYALQVAAYLLRTGAGGAGTLRTSAVAPRALRALADWSYHRELVRTAPVTVFLTQVGRLLRRARGIDPAGDDEEGDDDR